MTKPPALGGMVYYEGDLSPENAPEIGDVLTVNGREHVVIGVTGNYVIEKDRWVVTYKLSAIRDARITHDDPPEWVEELIAVAEPARD